MQLLACDRQFVKSIEAPAADGVKLNRRQQYSYYREEKTVQHKGTILIETDRLILRKFRMADKNAAFRNWTNDDNVTKYLRWPAHKSLETTETVLQTWIDRYADKNFYQWAITLKSKGEEPIGTIGVVDQNETLNIVHIGYCIGSKWWNQGITSEAFAGIIPFFFEQVKANRIESQHDPRNPNSGRVMRKCGLQYEGTLRQADISNQGIVDAAMYSLLASEYYAKRTSGR